MCLLSSFFETIESSKIGVQALAALLLMTAGLHFGKRQFKSNDYHAGGRYYTPSLNNGELKNGIKQGAQ